eukprot:CAMPEP_0197193974 /NCGR_PEP_ID=MMETSP1423-20130617/28398_1 /TAXON_ID=476441 /ORGANISM="Pseudo-nitzschia heimii, Strain UNC1101" /LENGTH=603 /DNA_ID=CAMNT_0042647311 /DNA_START=68 /DNA_END=1876 /DNA_ORIENTATION=+
MARKDASDTGTSKRSTQAGAVGRLKIERPTTTNDDGDPTDDSLFDTKRVFRLIDDERYLSAEELHQSIRDRIQTEIDNGADFNDSLRSPEKNKSSRTRKKRPSKPMENRMKMALQLLEENEDVLKKMKDRCIIFKKAKKNLDVNDDWTLAQTLFGVTTYYRHESDGSMSIKLEGRTNDCSLFDQVAVMREFDLNYLWAPFVTSSMTIAYLDKLDMVGWFHIGLPHFGLMRDALFRAIGCDSIFEDGSIMIVAQGIADRPKINKGSGENDESKIMTADFEKNVESGDASSDQNDEILKGLREDPILDTLDLPLIPTRIGGGRLTIRSFEAQIHLESPTSAMTTLVANIDPNMHLLPQILVDFVMKRICGTILYKMKVAGKNITRDPITNLHAIKIREEKDFYKTFLLPKFEGLCKIRGWQIPSISAFELSDAQLEMAEMFKAKQKLKSETKAIKLLNSNGKESTLDDYLRSTVSRSMASEEIFNGLGHSTQDGPKVRTGYNDLDDMSDISKLSTLSSFWSSNPISNYRRQVEERIQLRKHREIQESRERAAARLKPKHLNEKTVLRLKELRSARSQRKSWKQVQELKEKGIAFPKEMDSNFRRW